MSKSSIKSEIRSIFSNLALVAPALQSVSTETAFYSAIEALLHGGHTAAAETLYSKYAAKFENQSGGTSDNRQDAVDYQENLETYSDGEPRQAAGDRAKLAAYGLPVAPRPRPIKPARSNGVPSGCLLPTYSIDFGRLVRNILNGEHVTGADWQYYITADPFINASVSAARAKAEFVARFAQPGQSKPNKIYATKAEKSKAYRSRKAARV